MLVEFTINEFSRDTKVKLDGDETMVNKLLKAIKEVTDAERDAKIE
jgi:hypothetical protein